MNYYTKGNLVIIRKHILLLLFRSTKVIMYFLVAWLLYWLTIKYRVEFWQDLVRYLMLPSILFIVNFWFFKLILYIVQHYNNLLIFYNDHLVVIKSSFILIDDIEVLDVYKVTKIDTYRRGFMANVFWYWTVIVEQTRDEVRKFSFIPDPQRTLWLFREQKEVILNQRAKRFEDWDTLSEKFPDRELEEGTCEVCDVVDEVKRKTNEKIRYNR